MGTPRPEFSRRTSPLNEAVQTLRKALRDHAAAQRAFDRDELRSVVKGEELLAEVVGATKRLSNARAGLEDLLKEEA